MHRKGVVRPDFAIYSRKQKSIYNDSGRSSDLLPIPNAFPMLADWWIFDRR